MSFSAQLRGFAQGTQDKIDKTVKGATVTLLTNVIVETPFDKGTARGNWQTTIGEPATGVLDRKDPSGAQAIADMTAAVPDKAGSVVVMANNLPYINELEYKGHSQQAPGGMVRVHAPQFQRYLDAEAAKHK